MKIFLNLLVKQKFYTSSLKYVSLNLDYLSFIIIIFFLIKDLLCSPQDILGEQGGLVRVAVTVQELVLRYTKA